MTIRRLVHVSASLRADGGGAAHFARVSARILRRFAAERELEFSGLHLACEDHGSETLGFRSHGGSKRSLAGAVVRAQLEAPAAIFFDHPGPARVQGALPAAVRGRHAIALLGIDAWRSFDLFGRRSLATARELIAISGETARRAAPFLPAGCVPSVVHPGIEPLESAGEPDEDLLARAGTDFVLTVGRLAGPERAKGFDELIRAIAELRRRGRAPRLVVAGEGSDRDRLERLASDGGVADLVLFTGGVARPTLAELYRRSSLFALPSRLEGFGLVFVEAMAAGRPCVALAGTAPAEIVVDGETGRLVADEVPALATAIADLLDHPAWARELGRAGRRRYEEEFTPEAFERRFVPRLEALIA